MKIVPIIFQNKELDFSTMQIVKKEKLKIGIAKIINEKLIKIELDKSNSQIRKAIWNVIKKGLKPNVKTITVQFTKLSFIQTLEKKDSNTSQNYISNKPSQYQHRGTF